MPIGRYGAEAEILGVGPADWHLRGIGDFNGDGRADLLWRHDTGTSDAGVNVIWEMNGAQKLLDSNIRSVSTDYYLASVADANGDGKSDITWSKSDNTQLVTWWMDGANIISEQTREFAHDWSVLKPHYDII